MVPPFVHENSLTFHLQVHGEDVYRSREISGNPATVFDLLQVSVKPLGYQFEEMVLGTQSRISIRRLWRKIQATAEGKRRKKLELRLGLNCPLNQRRSISISQSFSYAPCFQGASLSISSKLYCKNWTYLPAILVKLLSGVNVRANIFRMEKQNITISDECSGFRAQFYSPRREFIYDVIEFPQNKAKCMHSLDLKVHCEICAYLRFCETKELKGENNI